MGDSSNVSRALRGTRFFEQLTEAFKPLIDKHQLHAGRVSTPESEEVLLLNDQGGLMLSLTETTQALDVRVFKVTGDGGIPSPTNQQHSVPLSFFLPAGDAQAAALLATPYTPEGEVLAQYARVVDTYASKVLAGDSKAFKTAHTRRTKAPPGVVPDAARAEEVTFPPAEDTPAGNAPLGFPEQAVRAFAFLARQGFQVAGLGSSDAQDVILFTGGATAVEVRHDKKHGLLRVGLVMRETEDWVLEAVERASIPLASVLGLARPDLKVSPPRVEPSRVGERLDEYAKALEACASLVLKDNSPILTEAYRRMRLGLGA
jgi:hypothetical protein